MPSVAHADVAIALAIVVACSTLASSVVAQTAQPSFRPSAWRGGVLFDEDVRSAMRLREPSDRDLAAAVSDVLLATTVLDVAGIDALVVPLVQRDQVFAWRASAAHLLGIGLTVLLGEIVKGASGRARPFERECRDDPHAARCRGSDTFEAFYSLHSGVAFASAGTSCALHASRTLDGDVASDAVSCAISLALATTTGLLRVASDRHYLSDVIVGGLVGFLVGYVIPLWIVPERSGPTVSTIGLGTVSIRLSGRF
jgi:membrane-associated phospholipid phosphatase